MSETPSSWQMHCNESLDSATRVKHQRSWMENKYEVKTLTSINYQTKSDEGPGDWGTLNWLQKQTPSITMMLDFKVSWENRSWKKLYIYTIYVIWWSDSKWSHSFYSILYKCINLWVKLKHSYYISTIHKMCELLPPFKTKAYLHFWFGNEIWLSWVLGVGVGGTPSSLTRLLCTKKQK